MDRKLLFICSLCMLTGTDSHASMNISLKQIMQNPSAMQRGNFLTASELYRSVILADKTIQEITPLIIAFANSRSHTSTESPNAHPEQSTKTNTNLSSQQTGTIEKHIQANSQSTTTQNLVSQTSSDVIDVNCQHLATTSSDIAQNQNIPNRIPSSGNTSAAPIIESVTYQQLIHAYTESLHQATEEFKSRSNKGSLSYAELCEVINAVMEQLLPFADAMGLLSRFLQFLEKTPHLNLRTKEIITSYPKIFDSSRNAFFSSITQKFYIKIHYEQAIPKQGRAGNCVQSLFAYYKKFISTTYETCLSQRKSFPQKEVEKLLCTIAMQHLLPIASERSCLWGFLSKFRTGNKDSLKEFANSLRIETPSLDTKKYEQENAELFWEHHAERLLQISREIAHEYVHIFQKDLTFGSLTSPV